MSDSSSAVLEGCREVEGLDHRVHTSLTFGGGDVWTEELLVSVQVSRAVTTPLLLSRSHTQQLYAPSASRRICYALYAPQSFTVAAIIVDTHSKPLLSGVEVAVLGSPSLIVLMVSVDVKQH